MQSRDMRKNKEISLACFLLILGIAVSLISGMIIIQSDRARLYYVMDESFDTIKSRIVRWNNYEVGDRTKSEVRLLDKAKELSRCLKREEASDALLEQYAYEQRLDGILVTDADNVPTYGWGEIDESVWDEFLNNDVSYDASHYPENSYATRMDIGGSQYDFAIVSRQDQAGCVAVLSEKREIFAKDEISIQTLLDDFIFELKGTAVIASGDEIISTNDEELKGKCLQDWLKMSAEDFGELNQTSNLIRLTINGRHLCGDVRRVEGYDIYIFFPEVKVYSTFIMTESFGIILYVLACILFLFLRYKQEEKNREKSAEQLRTISSISRVYSFVLLIDLGTDSWKVLKSADKMESALSQGSDVKYMLKRYAEHVLTEAYQEDFLRFSDMADMAARVAGKTYVSCVMEEKNAKWEQLFFVPQKYDEDGKLQEVIFLCRDVSTEKKKEIHYQNSLRRSVEHAERASVAKTDFLRRMSHDIRTPINGIKGMIEISRYYAGDEEKQEECRQKIVSASSFLLDLVNNVLDMNKLESGQVRLEQKPFDLLELFRETVSLVEVQAVECQVDFQVDVCKGVHWNVLGSPLHLRQILQNIMSNAIKYNREGGTVHVSVEETGSTRKMAIFVFTCQDTGLGMSEEFQKRAFEPFAQENASARTSYAGTGLGLPIAKELTEKMGGSIHFTSQQGQGTTFTIELHFKLADHVEDKEDSEDQDICLDGIHVLLVEDNDLNMEIAQFILENAGAAVTKAWNGQEAVDCFLQSEGGTYDIILMDIMMPVMDGLDAARCIRSLDRSDAKSVPIFAITANAFSDDKERSYKAGMNEHISKPIIKKDLLRIMKKYIPK